MSSVLERAKAALYTFDAGIGSKVVREDDLRKLVALAEAAGGVSLVASRQLENPSHYEVTAHRIDDLNSALRACTEDDNGTP